MPPLASISELQAAGLQAAITLGLVVLCVALYRTYRKRYFLWWAVGWGLYALRIGAILLFLTTGTRAWLYWHQVTTGWTALAILYAALVFWAGTRFRPGYVALALFPPLWSYVAIYRLEDFLLAAGPAVLFLSLATLWTALVFARYRREAGSRAGRVLAIVFLLWGLHHLDYPLLRARGAWNPWGYYLDILFVLATGVGIMLLVMEDLHRGLATLSTLSGDLHRPTRDDDVLTTLLERPLSLGGVRGSAMFVRDGAEGRIVRGTGSCRDWAESAPPAVAQAIARAVAAGQPVVAPGQAGEYTAVLPILQHGETRAALVIVGGSRDPFTALDQGFLVALGQQVGAALENADLYHRLAQRAAELERLSARMVRQNEEQRRRLSLELHDETAQVFAAVKLQLGLLRGTVGPDQLPRIDRLLELIDTGIRGIRSITNDLRPPVLDDLGWLPAIRAMVADFAERTGLAAHFEAGTDLPTISKDAELALFRGVQEALTNVARHAGAQSVVVRVARTGPALQVRIRDDGRGLAPGFDLEMLERDGHLGLAGMRERITAVGGTVTVTGETGSGARIEIVLPELAHA